MYLPEKTRAFEKILRSLDRGFVVNEYSEKIKNLVNEGADPRALGNGTSALHLAVRLGEVSLISFFTEKGVPIDIINSNGRTPLFIAVSAKKLPIIKELARHGANLEGKFPDERPEWQSIRKVALDTKDRAIYYELVALGMDCEGTLFDDNTENLLHRMIRYGHQYLSFFLDGAKEKGSLGDYINKPNDDGLTPYDFAWAFRNNKTMQLLLSYGADPAAGRFAESQL